MNFYYTVVNIQLYDAKCKVLYMIYLYIILHLLLVVYSVQKKLTIFCLLTLNLYEIFFKFLDCYLQMF